MTQTTPPAAASPPPALPRNVKVLGLVSLVNDIASEMIYPLLPISCCWCCAATSSRWA